MAETRIAAAQSSEPDPYRAAEQASSLIEREIGIAPDLVVLMLGSQYIGDPARAVAAVQTRLRPRHLIGASVSGVIGPQREIEDGGALAVWGASLPGASIEVEYLADSDPNDDSDSSRTGAEEVRTALEIILADPGDFAIGSYLARLNGSLGGVPVIGGLAGAPTAKQVLIEGGRINAGGAVVCRLGGVEVLPCVSQGATPIGPELTITSCRQGVITGLASRPAVERVGEVLRSLGASEQALIGRGLMLGIVVDENRPEHSHGDYLVRPILGADPDSGSIAIGEAVRVGQSVRLHVRDPARAEADLREAVSVRRQALGPRGAAGALVFGCNGRGVGMFEAPDRDLIAISESLEAPVAGCFCAGEIGPVGGRNFLHGFTATAAIFGAG